MTSLRWIKCYSGWYCCLKVAGSMPGASVCAVYMFSLLYMGVNVGASGCFSMRTCSEQSTVRQLGQTPAPQSAGEDGWIKCPLITADRKVCLVRVRSEAPALRSYPCTAPAKTLGPGLSHVRLPAGSISHAERPLCVTALEAADCRQRLPTSRYHFLHIDSLCQKLHHKNKSRPVMRQL